MRPDPEREHAELVTAVYAQLRAAAQRAMAGERAGQTLGATALVHEAYLKLAGPRDVPWDGRRHMYAAAVEAARRVLLDHAKARARIKRGGGAMRVDLDGPLEIGVAAAAPGDDRALDDRAAEFLALDDAMRRLEERDPRAAEVVRIRFYAGLGIAQAALVLGVSERTVKNDWALAKAWLQRELER